MQMFQSTKSAYELAKLWNTDIGVTSKKLLNAVRTHLLEMVTQLARVTSKDNLIEGPGSLTCWTEVNVYLLCWSLDKLTAVHKACDVLTECDGVKGLTQPLIIKLTEETPHPLSFLRRRFITEKSSNTRKFKASSFQQ